MLYSHNGEIREEVKRLLSEGWTLRRGGKHQKLYSPDGKVMVTIPGSTCNGRIAKQWKCEIRRKLQAVAEGRLAR